MPALDPPLAGLVARYRGDSLVDDGGGFASAWNDLSGNGYHLSQATAANRPAIVADILNGQPGARFDGANDQLFRTTTPTISQPITFVAISKLTLSNSNHKGIVSTQSGTQCRLQYDVSEAGSIYAGSTVITDAGSDLNTWRWHIGEINGANSKLYEDGVLVASGNPGAGTVAGIKVGAHATDTQFFGGDIAEILVYDHALGSSERAQMALYARARYGFAVPFPQTSAPTVTAISTASDPLPISMPPTVEAGDLLLVALAANPDRDIQAPPGWTELWNADISAFPAEGRFIGAAKVADGTEGGTTVDFDPSGNATAAAHCYRITEWFGTLSGVRAGTVNAGASSSPNPPSLGAPWGVRNTLWLALGGAVNDDEAWTAAAADYANLVSTLSGGGADSGASVDSARRQLAAASDDPSVFTLAGSEAWGALTVAIRPLALPRSGAGIMAAGL